MSEQLTIPKANPNVDAKGQFQFLNRPMQSQYYESEYSIFGSPYNAQMGTAPTMTGMPVNGMMMGGMMPGMGMGLGMYGGWYGDVDKYVDNAKKWNNGYYDILDNSSDRQTKFVFKQRGNQYALNTSSEILNKKLREMASYIKSNDMGVATKVFDEVCDEIENEVGQELKTHEERINAKRSIRAAVAKYYAQVNGNDLESDIKAHGDGYFMHGLKEGFFGGGFHENSAEETIAYMQGTTIEGYDRKQSYKNIGKGLGYVTPAVGLGVAGGIAQGALKGKKFGWKGAAIGAVVGAVISGVAALVNGGGKNEYVEVNSY